MKQQTKAIDTPFQKKDAYGALSMPVYHTCAYEFDTAAQMTDAFTGRVLEPDYSRVMNPTVTYFENKVKAVTGAANVFAFSSGMQAITNALLSVVEAGKTIVSSPHLFGNTFALITKTLAIHPYSTIFGNFTPLEKASMDVLPTTIRLSIGLEDTEGIVNDIIQALR